jgi:hypothetical protein
MFKVQPYGFEIQDIQGMKWDLHEFKRNVKQKFKKYVF